MGQFFNLFFQLLNILVCRFNQFIRFCCHAVFLRFSRQQFCTSHTQSISKKCIIYALPSIQLIHHLSVAVLNYTTNNLFRQNSINSIVCTI